MTLAWLCQWPLGHAHDLACSHKQTWKTNLASMEVASVEAMASEGEKALGEEWR